MAEPCVVIAVAVAAPSKPFPLNSKVLEGSMDWNFTLGTIASGSINSRVFENARIEIELSACRLAGGEFDRHFAIFNGLGVVIVDGKRFSFDPNRYGLRLECERQPGGEWLSVAFGTADTPVLLAGFGLPRWFGLEGVPRLQAATDSGMHYSSTLEALDGATLEMATVELARGACSPTLSVSRNG